MTTFAIVKLGCIKHRIDFERIRTWSSQFFRITSTNTLAEIPDGRVGWQQYTDDDLRIVARATDADLTVAITEYAIQDNFYMRHVTDRVIVMSFHEVADLLERHNIPLEYLVLCNLYTCALLHQIGTPVRPTSEEIPDIFHDQTRSCLFDMNGLKSDVVFSTANPSICDQCRARLSRSQLPDDTLPHLERELRRIRKPVYYRIAGFVKQRPILSLCIAAVAGIFVNVLANCAYDVLRKLVSSR